MSSEIEVLIRRLREAERRRHVEAMEAITTLERNMLGSGGHTEGGHTSIAQEAPTNGAREAGEPSNVDRVLGVLDERSYMTVEQVMRETGLEEAKVRGALYGRSTQSRVQKRRIGKRMTFRLKIQSPSREPNQGTTEGPTAAEQVRSVLREHPAGLRAREIRKALPHVKATTVGAALYNMKNKGKTVVYDEATQTYRLNSGS